MPVLEIQEVQDALLEIYKPCSQAETRWIRSFLGVAELAGSRSLIVVERETFFVKSAEEHTLWTVSDVAFCLEHVTMEGEADVCRLQHLAFHLRI